MKFFILGSLLFSTATFAQSMDLNGFKSLLTARQATLEKVHAGMTKTVVTTFKDAECGLRRTAVQSILKIEGEKVFILSKEKTQPQNTPACRELGYLKVEEQNIVYLESKPSLSAELADLDASASSIKAITKNGDIVVLHVTATETEDDGRVSSENVTIKYDLTKPSFKYLISSQSVSFLTVSQDSADIDLTKVDLTNVLLCADNDGDEAECTLGDYSDILF